MNFIFICQYCNYKWERQVYLPPKNAECPKCKDKNIDIREKETKDYYGSTDSSND